MLTSQPQDKQSPECQGGKADDGETRAIVTDRDALVAAMGILFLDEEKESIRILLKKILTGEMSSILKLTNNSLVTLNSLNTPRK